jgi:hypothetical protein
MINCGNFLEVSILSNLYWNQLALVFSHDDLCFSAIFNVHLGELLLLNDLLPVLKSQFTILLCVLQVPMRDRNFNTIYGYFYDSELEET